MVRPPRTIGLTFFRSAAACLHVPTRLTPEPTKHEGRKPRASERHAVGCCEELGAAGRIWETAAIQRLGIFRPASRMALRTAVLVLSPSTRSKYFSPLATLMTSTACSMGAPFES